MPGTPPNSSPIPNLVSTAPVPPPFPVIVGVGRSGTTLLLAMLDAHPDLAVAHEATFIASLGKSRARYETPTGWDRHAFERDLWKVSEFRSLELPPAAVRDALDAAEPGTFADATRAVFGCYAAHRGKPRYADKTAGYVIRMGLVAELLPETRFVHVVRDGRDCALAFADRGFGPQSVADAALGWQSRLNRGREVGARLGPERYMEVRYEDLVEDPERSLRAVADFIDLFYDERMLRYHDRERQVVTALEKPDIFENLARPPTKGLRDWRTTMAPDDARLFEALAGRTLVELGYERSSPTTGIGVGARALMARGGRLGRRALYFAQSRGLLPGRKSGRRRARSTLE